MKKFKFYALIIVIISSILLFTGIGYWGFKGNNIVTDWQEAQHLFQTGKLAQSSSLLQSIVSRDLSHEKAFLLLAKISEEQKKHLDAAYYYAAAIKLNEFDLTLPVKHARALFNAGQYEALNQFLHKKYEDKTLSNEEFTLFVESMAYVGNTQEAKEILNHLPPALLEKIDIQLIKKILMVRTGDSTLQEATLEPFLNHSNPHYQWIANYSLAELSKTEPDRTKTEKYYLVAYKINPEKTVLSLADFYKANNQLPEAQKYLEESREYYTMNFKTAIDLAEIYATTNNDSAFIQLQNSIKIISQESIETRYYLDAIKNYMKNEYAAIAQCLQLAKRYEDRGFYIFLKFLSDAVANRVNELPTNLNRVLTKQLTSELREQIESLMMMMLAQANKHLRKDEASIIATQILRITAPNSQPFLSANQTLAITRIQENNYIQAIQAAENVLKMDPLSHLANGVMAEALFQTQAYEKSLPYFERAQEIKDLELKHVHALIASKHHTQADALLKKLYHKNTPFDQNVFNTYIHFLMHQNRFDDAKAICHRVDSSIDQQYAKNKALADLAWAQNKDTAQQYHYYHQAIKNLNAFPQTPEVIYNIAYLYASMNEDQKAAVLYEQLLKNHPTWDMVLVNLSEVKAALGDDVAAYEYANRALTLYPTWEIAQHCMKRRKPIKKAERIEPLTLDSIIQKSK